jgi:hypothetical protein
MAFSDGFGGKQNSVLCGWGYGQDCFSLETCFGHDFRLCYELCWFELYLSELWLAREPRTGARGRNDDTKEYPKIVHTKATRGVD